MSQARPLDAQQRRYNYIFQRAVGVPHPSFILTPAQYRRLCKKSKGRVVRIWVPATKRFQAIMGDSSTWRVLAIDERDLPTRIA